MSMRDLFWLIVFLMPLLSVSPLQFFIQKPFYYGLVYYSLIAIALSLSILNKERPVIDNSIKLLGIFWGINLLSLLFGPGLQIGELDSSAGYGTFALVYLFFNIATVYLATNRINIQEDIEKTSNILFIASSLASLWGILIVLLHLTNIVPQGVLPVPLFPRLSGSATEPQVYGNFLLSVIFINMAFMSINNRPIYYIAFMINLFALAMTFSMGAWLAFGIAFILFMIISLKHMGKSTYLKVGCAFMIIIACLGMLQLLNRSYLQDYGRYISKLKIWRINSEVKEYKQDIKGRNPEEFSSHLAEKHDDKMVRFWMAQTAVNMFIKNPVLGIGPGNYRFKYNEYKPSGTPRKENERTHNAYLEILAESGIFGFLAFIGLLTHVFIRSTRARLKLKESRSILLYYAIIMGIVALLIQGLSFGILAHNHTWMALGLLLSATIILEKNESIT